MKPCPFCGSNRVEIKEVLRHTGLLVMAEVAVTCLACNAHGPVVVDGAEERWDDRGSQPPTTSGALEILKEAWQELAVTYELPLVRSWSRKRITALAKRLHDDPDWIASAIEAMRRITKTPWLLGKNDRGWKANIDWFLQPDSVTKILEGAYAGEAKTKDSPARVRADNGGANIRIHRVGGAGAGAEDGKAQAR